MVVPAAGKRLEFRSFPNMRVSGLRSALTPIFVTEGTFIYLGDAYHKLRLVILGRLPRGRQLWQAAIFYTTTIGYAGKLRSRTEQSFIDNALRAGVTS